MGLVSSAQFNPAMAFEFKSESFCAELASAAPLEQVLRARYAGASWSAVRRLVSTGKVKVDAAPAGDARQLVAPGARVEIQMAARRPRAGEVSSDQVLYVDPHVVVVRKPAGISSVEHEDEPTSLQAQIREWLSGRERRACPPLKVVHRLDKVTSGVMLFARSQPAQLALKDQFRAHTTGRYYIAVAHGEVHEATLSFRLVRDRGDGLRGVTTDPNRGRHSITHVSVVERLARCTVLRCQLETGRTHQIRIHLAQVGHPVLGDPLYGRELPGLIAAPRTMLHAAYLSFVHPAQRRRLAFEQPPPAEFAAFIAAEREQGRPERAIAQRRGEPRRGEPRRG